MRTHLLALSFKTGRPGETNHAGTGNRLGMNLMPNVWIDWFVSDLELQIEVVPVCNRRGNNFPFKGHRAKGVRFDLFLTVINLVESDVEVDRGQC